MRVLVERRRLAPPLTPNHDDERTLLLLGRRLYRRLPQQHLLKLSVLKLDGSLFDIEVGRNATVAELKQAVEEVFTTSPKQGVQEMISWSHVWGHFCLCYDGQKLINDKACLRMFGIKDGDQLQFIRHMCINCTSSRRRSNKQTVTDKPFSIGRNENQNYNSKCYQYEDQEEIPVPEFKLANFLKGWLSYSGLWGASRKGSKGKNRPSRFGMQSLLCNA